MKIRNIYLLMPVFCLIGCSDFLEESSQDEVRPAMVSDLEQILLGDGYRDGHNFFYMSEIFTDNQKSVEPLSNVEDEYERNKWRFLWDSKMFDDDGGGYNGECWEVHYKGILGCNLVLEYLDDMKGKDYIRESLRGEALTLRSWYYLHLVNFFGIAYNQGNPATDLGVPLKLDPTVTGQFFTRNTVEEVYLQIERDLLHGIRLLSENKYDRNFFRIDHLAAKAMLSRVYLYMENWDKALAYADSVLMVKSNLLDLNDGGRVYHTSSTPDEIIWAREYNSGYEVSFQPRLSPPFIASDDLVGIYTDNVDLRQKIYLYYDGSITRGYAGVNKGYYDYAAIQGIRTAELYLNRAEVYSRKYLAGGQDEFRVKALADLNELRKYRISKSKYIEVNLTDGQELLDFCLLERRRELCGETCHRWCDVRRLGVTVTHLLYDSSIDYQQDMGHYVLPIPKLITEQNPALEQNQ